MQKEAYEQQALFEWAASLENVFPELALMFHIPNGGSRNRIEAHNLKTQGVKAGIPDICLPVARGGYHGLFIELKVKPNRATEKQLWWLQKLKERGYCAKVCYGCAEASQTILKYLEWKEVR